MCILFYALTYIHTSTHKYTYTQQLLKCCVTCSIAITLDYTTWPLKESSIEKLINFVHETHLKKTQNCTKKYFSFECVELLSMNACVFLKASQQTRSQILTIKKP